jgi:monofunctional biosynthetic peptidoglycan transglycosylase
MTDSQPARRSRRRRLWKWLLLWLPLIAVTGSTAQVLILRWVPPVTSAIMIGREVDALFEGDWRFRLHYQWRDWSRISPNLPIALVAAEDQKFPFHNGFDFEAIDKARVHNERSHRVRGASTISQQLAKNLFCWSGRSYLRKAVEAWYTVLIELFWPKQRILEVYANIAEFGDGVYGAEAAAQSYFGKPASALSLAESARLAAVLPNPKRYSAKKPGGYVLARAHWIERQVRHLGGSAYLSSAP